MKGPSAATRLVWLAGGMLAAAALAFGGHALSAMPGRVQAESNVLRMWITGAGGPTVVFDTFGPASLEVWNRVQPRVSEFARCVSFDHGGYWGSTPGTLPRDASRLARELRAALSNAGLPPPYLLVGYSMGGPYARVFAGEYPGEVAGMVLVDPTQEEFMDFFRAKFPELNRVSSWHREAQDEIANVENSLNQARASRLPEVPITLITGIKPHDLLARRLLRDWLASHRTWLAQFPRTEHITTTNSGHDVVRNEPGLVVDAIRRTIERRAVPGHEAR